MLHQVEITLYVIISVVLLFKATQRPVWGVGYYMLNFFAQPNYWPWGIPLRHPSLRWSWYSAWFLLAVTLMRPTKTSFKSDSNSGRASIFLLLMLANAALVHFSSAYDPKTSYGVLTELAKFSVLHFLILAAVRSKQDFLVFLGFFTVGLGYWGFEAKFVGVTLIHGRLEDFGGPGCAASNELASITATLLPIIGGSLVLLVGARRIFAVLAFCLSLNILMLCNSRGGFVGLIAAAMILPILTTGRARKLAINGLAAGLVGVLLLAGNPQIFTRFLTTFVADTADPSSDDEANKRTRKIFWKAGLSVMASKPFGSGGKCFKSGLGNSYLMNAGLRHGNRSCHQGYLEEGMSWGIQGLFFRLGYVISAGLAALHTSRFRSKIGDFRVALAGVCILGGFSALLITSIFGDFLQMEWGFWLCITAIAYTKIYGKANYGTLPDTLVGAEAIAAGQRNQQRAPQAAGAS